MRRIVNRETRKVSQISLREDKLSLNKTVNTVRFNPLTLLALAAITDAIF